MTVELGSLVRERWAVLLAEGFEITHEGTHRIDLESPLLELHVVHDPRGEVEVRAVRPGTEGHAGWSYSGMVGRADVGRLLDLALEEMCSDPDIVVGDPAFYEVVARNKAAEAKAWTEYAARRGPRQRRLP